MPDTQQQIDPAEVLMWIKANKPEVLAEAIRSVQEINEAFMAEVNPPPPVKKK